MKLRLWLAPALFVFAAGCGMSMADSASLSANPSMDAWDASSGAASEAGVNSGAANFQGSPLCYPRSGVRHCSPDQLTACASDGGVAADLKGDGGPSPWLDAALPPGDADGGTTIYADAGAPSHDAGAALACRVVRRGGETSPQCVAAGNGTDGDACRISSDCGVGFECVGSPGQCRRYCCGGGEVCGSDGVCDKQIVVGTEGMHVPVCVPIHPCKLLAVKACPDNETCAIADQTDGRTSCLAIGPATAGESCETQNCAAGLTCLGEEGLRSCYKLCIKSKAGDCPSDSKCRGTTPLFQDPDQGVCIKEIPSR